MRCLLLTEQEVSRSWRSLFQLKGVSEEAFVHAEHLLDELRPESPLRHRLSVELDELRELKRRKRKVAVTE
jgi:hypothetical protein